MLIIKVKARSQSSIKKETKTNRGFSRILVTFVFDCYHLKLPDQSLKKLSSRIQGCRVFLVKIEDGLDEKCLYRRATKGNFEDTDIDINLKFFQIY